MKRIFYYSGYRLTVFHWQKNQCVAAFAFDPGEHGLEKFITYLRATHNSPVRILVDLIEEDFKKDNIPHVSLSDRKSIVKRMIDRHYRKSRDYVHYQVVGRESSGRKDDILLYSVLSNPEILEPWLKPMQQEGINVSGIWSLPLLSHRLYAKIDAKTPNLLLVSQQVPSNLRQSFIKKGQFQSSRSAVVNLEEASIGEYIATEVESTIRYLSNQRQIGFDEKIQVHIICRDADLQQIQQHCIDTQLLSYHYHDLSHVEQSLACNTQGVEYCNGIYSYICARQALPVGHYGNPSLFVKYYEYISSIGLYAASLVLFICGLIFSAANLIDATLFDEESRTLMTQAEGINREYEKRLSRLEPRLKRAKLMQSSVLLYQHIQDQKSLSPQNFMVDISRILSRSGMFDTQIRHIHWQQHQSQELPGNNNQVKKIPSVDYASGQGINQLATIQGKILISQGNLKDAVTKANAIAQAFKANRQVLKVNIKRLPVDVRSKSRIELETSADSRQSSSAELDQGLFEIQLIMKGRQS